MTHGASPAGSVGASALAELAGCVGGEEYVRAGELDRFALAHDASHFLLVPQAVVTPGSARDMSALLRLAARRGLPLTFRSGGSSLSGQSVTDGLLVDVRGRFREVEVLDGGLRVRAQPGVTVRALNARLAPYGRAFGPDPASEAACTIGGVVANNSSGMACGTVENSYRTLESLVAVLPSGTVVDTGAGDADALLRAREPELYAGLLALRERVTTDPRSLATVRAQFAMKNTMGYGLNSLLDYASPADILAHLLVGSEGTLAFVASATFRTVPLRRHAASALLVFDDLYAANHALPDLVATGAATLELMDATSLRVGQGFADCPAQIAALTVRQQAALLVEYQATAADELADLVGPAEPALRRLRTTAPAELTTDPAVRGSLWKLRKGLYTSVAGARPSGTTALLEDVVVPVAALADTCAELAVLFDRYAYRDSVIFGHAKDGNVHFMLTDRFETAEQLDRYSAFTEDMVDLVLGHGGSLKAEHGTGRVMAPYVRRQYGDELYDVMWQVKRLFDPDGLLNPGVLLSEDDRAHLKDIKLPVPVESEVDRCVECGFCEPVCPSKDLTLTPRQRIAARREIAVALAAGDERLAGRLEADYEYAGKQTCAVDGMCQTACPVLINTGDLVKRLRRETQPPRVDAGWRQAARHWSGFTRASALALTAAGAVPAALDPAILGGSALARRVGGSDHVPLWSPELPGGGRSRRAVAEDAGLPTAGSGSGPARAVDAVYLPACVNTMFGPAEGSSGVQDGLQRLCAAAGVRLAVPAGVDGLCCGTPWSSKGLPRGYDAMRDRVVPALRAATGDGAVPVVVDATSCTEGLRHLLEKAVDEDGGPPMRVLDALELVDELVLPRLGEHPRLATLALHPTCSSTRMGANPVLARVAAEVADQVVVPQDWGCCAFAGDRGLLHPELTASATARESAQVKELDAVAHASCNRTCELGMTRATGATYRHVLELLAEIALPAPS